MEINFSQIASNFNSVDINGVRVFFSYETAIAFSIPGQTVVRQNVWSTTTGKHLNRVDGGDKTAKAARVDGETFTLELHRALAGSFVPTAS